MFSLSKKRSNIALTVFVFVLMLSLIFGLSISIFSPMSYALPVLTEKVISNEAYALKPPVSIENINFEKQWTRSGYDSAYTSGRSTSYNGTATPDHLVIKDGRISFFGYQIPAYFDAVFTSDYMLDKLEFDFVPKSLLFHTLHRTGFFINSKIENGKISGYLLSLEPSVGFVLYEVKGMDLDAYNQNQNTMNKTAASFYFPSNSSATYTKLQENRSRPFTQTSPNMHFEIESTDTSFTINLVYDSENPASQKEMLFTQSTPSSDDRGFGVFMQNNSHNCEQLTVVTYEGFKITATPVDEDSEAQVNFVLNGTTTQIAESQMEQGYVGGSYRITPPTIEGYTYKGSSRDTLTSINYEADNAKNVTILYYELTVRPKAPISGK